MHAELRLVGLLDRAAAAVVLRHQLLVLGALARQRARLPLHTRWNVALRAASR